LLALVGVIDGLAVRVLDEAGISKSMVEEQILVLIKRGTASEEGTLPFTPRAKAVLRRAAEEALRLGHNYVGTEHLLLGLVGDEDSVAAKVLLGLRASYGVIKDRTLELLGEYGND
jgi:ATP-dependent Clp protease ATP-binding subunit ClpC